MTAVCGLPCRYTERIDREQHAERISACCDSCQKNGKQAAAEIPANASVVPAGTGGSIASSCELARLLRRVEKLETDPR